MLLKFFGGFPVPPRWNLINSFCLLFKAFHNLCPASLPSLVSVYTSPHSQVFKQVFCDHPEQASSHTAAGPLHVPSSQLRCHPLPPLHQALSTACHTLPLEKIGLLGSILHILQVDSWAPFLPSCWPTISLKQFCLLHQVICLGNWSPTDRKILSNMGPYFLVCFLSS